MTMRGVVHVVKKKSYVEKLTYKVGTVEPKYESSGELNVLKTDFRHSVALPMDFQVWWF